MTYQPKDRDEALFVADQLAEVHDSMGTNNDRAARLLVALDAEAPGAVDELLFIAGERLTAQAAAGDEQAKETLRELLVILAGGYGTEGRR
jgi:hypothetical protein